MRIPTAVTLLLAPILTLALACGGDDDAPSEDAAVTDASSDAGADASEDASSTEDASTTQDAAADAPPDLSPRIKRIEWTHENVDTCQMAEQNPVTVVIQVEDPDTPMDQLTVSGSVTKCTGEIDSLNATISCSELIGALGTVTVTDPDANSDTEMFEVAPCTNNFMEYR